jgi:hypothetical protein
MLAEKVPLGLKDYNLCAPFKTTKFSKNFEHDVSTKNLISIMCRSVGKCFSWSLFSKIDAGLSFFDVFSP